MKLDVTQHSNQTLDDYWNKALFSVAEAMESGKYTLIPETLNDLSKEFTGVQATTAIDDNNVYVSL
ncbi:hypothetical protein D3C73_1539530 [compost metagenome]